MDELSGPDRPGNHVQAAEPKTVTEKQWPFQIAFMSSKFVSYSSAVKYNPNQTHIQAESALVDSDDELTSEKLYSKLKSGTDTSRVTGWTEAWGSYSVVILSINLFCKVVFSFLSSKVLKIDWGELETLSSMVDLSIGACSSRPELNGTILYGTFCLRITGSNTASVTPPGWATLSFHWCHGNQKTISTIQLAPILK